MEKTMKISPAYLSGSACTQAGTEKHELQVSSLSQHLQVCSGQPSIIQRQRTSFRQGLVESSVSREMKDVLPLAQRFAYVLVRGVGPKKNGDLTRNTQDF